MTHILQLCEETVWLEGGRIMMKGKSVEVAKSYEQYVRELEDRRLLAKNVKRRSGSYNYLQLEGTAALVVVRVILEEATDCECDVSEVGIWKTGELVERVKLGAPQDANALHGAF